MNYWDEAKRIQVSMMSASIYTEGNFIPYALLLRLSLKPRKPGIRRTHLNRCWRTFPPFPF